MDDPYGRILLVADFFKDPVRKNASTSEIPKPLQERLLTAAVEVFLEKGFAAASMDEIAARAKASKITFYNHYGSKEALFEAVVNRQNRILNEVMGGLVPEGMPIRKFLETVASRLYNALLRNETVKLVRVLHAEADRFPGLADVFNRSGPAMGRKLVAAALEKYMAVGTLRRTDADLASEHIFHLALGESTRRVLLGLRPAFTKAEVSTRIAAGIDVFLRAYGAA
jgi:TetR/AcrR family transcriptional repressor of mexJK operon